MDSSFKHQIKKDTVFVLLQNASLLREKTIMLIIIIQCVGQDIFKVLVFFNTVAVRATALNLTTLFKNGMGLTQAAVHHGEDDQSRQTVDANEQISDCYY
jgi:hypothetical protein